MHSASVDSAEHLDSSQDWSFEFTDRDFALVRRLLADHAGIALAEAKRDMVYSRLVRRLRALKLTRFRDYLDLLNGGDAPEFVNFVNALTTNLTSFFREPHHFDFLKKRVIANLCQARAESRRLRIWSAGCSTGEEPYSLAMTLLENMPNLSGWDVRILATDLDSNVLAAASAGVYGEDRVKNIPSEYLQRYFLRGRGANAGHVKASEELKSLITFKQLNLMEAWPMRGMFDVIFCRNVVIYFDKPTQTKLFARYADTLADDGYLFIGHSETLYKITDRFKLIGTTIYEKVRGGA